MQEEKPMRTLNVEEISKNIKEMCIEANHFLSKDMDIAMKNAVSTEKSPLGKKILSQLQDNLKIAGKDMIPICQDTGMAVVFLEIGQDVHFEGGNLEDAVNEGIRRGYVDGYLRKSVVKDPILRENTKDNTPGIIHYKIVPGDQVKIKVAPKGFGSEPCIYAETGRRNRRSKGSSSYGSKRCRSECLSSDGCRRGNRRHI